MSATPTNEQQGVTPQQAARLRRIQQGHQRYAGATWASTVRWTLASGVLRILSAGAMVVFSVQNAHMRSLLLSPATTAEQWNSAVHTENLLNGLSLLFLAAIVVPGQAWLRTRAYVARLPGAAPHPLQGTNATYRALNVPAYWPPVPADADSWTRRVHWRVPPALTAAYLVLGLGGGTLAAKALSGATRHAFNSVDELVVAVLLLAAGALDLVRLREYGRWPGRSSP